MKYVLCSSYSGKEYYETLKEVKKALREILIEVLYMDNLDAFEENNSLNINDIELMDDDWSVYVQMPRTEFKSVVNSSKKKALQNIKEDIKQIERDENFQSEIKHQEEYKLYQKLHAKFGKDI